MRCLPRKCARAELDRWIARGCRRPCPSGSPASRICSIPKPSSSAVRRLGGCLRASRRNSETSGPRSARTGVLRAFVSASSASERRTRGYRPTDSRRDQFHICRDRCSCVARIVSRETPYYRADRAQGMTANPSEVQQAVHRERMISAGKAPGLLQPGARRVILLRRSGFGVQRLAKRPMSGSSDRR